MCWGYNCLLINMLNISSVVSVSKSVFLSLIVGRVTFEVVLLIQCFKYEYSISKSFTKTSGVKDNHTYTISVKLYWITSEIVERFF